MISISELNNLNNRKKQNDQIGDSGQNIYSSSIELSTEYLVELQGKQGSINYSKMSKSDDQVGMMLTIYKNPIRSANWSIPLLDDSNDKENKAAEVLKEWMFKKSDLTFNSLLCQILSFLEFGYSCFEITWQPFTYEGNVYLMPQFHQRLQTSIENIYPRKGYLEQSTNSKGLVKIPLENMIFFILNQQGQDMRGVSLLRNAYANWKEKIHFKSYQAIGIQRSQTGIPSMVVPEDTDTESNDYIACETLLKNITCHEDAYMIIKKGFEFDIKSFNNDPEKIQKVIDKRDEKMAISVLAQFILLGTGGGGGAYALSRDQSDMFLDGLIYIVEYIEQQIQKYIVNPYVKINFGDSVDASKICVKGLNLNKKAGKELAETITSLASSGFIKAEIDDEKMLRKYLEMPDLSDEQIEKREQNKEQMDNLKKEDDEDDDKKIIINPTGKVSKVKLAERKNRKETLDIETKQLKDVMKANLLTIKDKLVADIKSTLNRGVIEIQGLKKIEVSYSKYAKNLERKLSGIANLGWENAKKKSKSKKIKLSEPLESSKLDSKTLKQFVLNESQSLAEDQVTSMKIQAILTASNSSLKGYSNNQAISNVEKVIDDFIEGQKVAVGASLASVGSMNFGETEFYKEISDQLWGYRFVAVDDGNTTEICSWYSGKTFSLNSAEVSTATPPLHPNALINGAKILTKDGEKNIEDIKVGDLVLTHNNRYREVYEVMNRFEDKHYYEIELENGNKINITGEHPVLVDRDGIVQWLRTDKLNLSDNIICLENINNVIPIS